MGGAWGEVSPAPLRNALVKIEGEKFSVRAVGLISASRAVWPDRMSLSGGLQAGVGPLNRPQ